MPHDKDIQNTLRGFAAGGVEVRDGDYDRGYHDAAPVGNYEASLGDDVGYDFSDGKMTERKVGTMHAGQIEDDGYRAQHGDMDQFGFVRRPTHKTDVERN